MVWTTDISRSLVRIRVGGTFCSTRQRHVTLFREERWKKIAMLPIFFQFCVFVVFLQARFQVWIRNMRRWCIGNIEASQALAPGSTPGRRIYYVFFFFVLGKKEVYSRGGLNSRPSACKADVITTRLLELLSDYTWSHSFLRRGFLLMEAKHIKKKRGAPHKQKKGSTARKQKRIQTRWSLYLVYPKHTRSSNRWKLKREHHTLKKRNQKKLEEN